MASEVAYTEEGPIRIPDKHWDHIPKECKIKALRGYGYIVAVVTKNTETCVGWANHPNPII